MKIFLRCLLFTLTFYPAALFSNTLVLTDSTTLYDAVRFTSCFEEGDSLAPAADILRGNFDSRFEADSKRQIDFGITDKRKWYRLEIRNETNAKYLIELDKGYIDHLDFYETNKSGYKLIHTGDLVSVSNKPLLTHSFLFPIQLRKGEQQVYYFSIRSVDPLQFCVNVGTVEKFLEWDQERVLYNGICFGIAIVMILFNLVIYFSIRDLSYLYYILYNFTLLIFFAYQSGFGNILLWGQHYPELNNMAGGMICVTAIFMLAFGNQFLHTRELWPRANLIFRAHIAAYIFIILLNCFGMHAPVAVLIHIVSLSGCITSIVAGIRIAYKGYSPAWIFLFGWGVFLTSIVIFILVDLGIIPYSNTSVNPMQIGSAAESVLFSLALANKMNFYKKEKDEAQQEAYLALEQNKQLILEQNILLEAKVKERTTELQSTNTNLALTLDNLKKTQDQLIHSEKMASLGQMAAGIAHEIDNPINFIRNFSESSVQLLDELKEDLPENEKAQIFQDLSLNLTRITEHGKRADRIVKSMILHSRNRGTELTQTNIVKLGRECLQVAYQGIRAQVSEFTCELLISEQPGIPEIMVIPQEISRVFLNVFQNAFYSMNEKGKAAKKNDTSYVPELKLSFETSGSELTIRVTDNGMGIPVSAKDKIFEPFFTTKPTGEGTGLGLSISYEIIVKVHGGKMIVNSPEGGGAELAFSLPISS